MPKELFNQPTTSEPSDEDRIALGQPSVSGGKNLKWSRFKEIVQSLLSTFDSILFNTSYVPTLTEEGEIYWNGKYYTIEIDTGLGKTITVGNEKYVVFHNDIGEEIQPGRVLHLKGGALVSGEIYPTFEYADATTYEKIQGTLTVSMHSVAIGAIGLCAVFSQKIKGVDTSSIPAGSQLWVSTAGNGTLTDTKPEFPNYAISVGGNYTQDPQGEIFVNFTTQFGDIYNESWSGSILETFDFKTSSDGVNVIGTLSNSDPLRDLTLNFSDGPSTLDTTTAPLTIALTPGTDANEQTNYVYIPKATKVLTVSTSGWPTVEHARIAQLDIQSAATTQADGGTLGNQNTNDHIKKEDDNGHILHIAAWIRKQFATMSKKDGSEATFDNTGGNGYIQITGGIMTQLHEQTLSSFSMPGESIRVWNDFSGNRPKISNLTSITAYSGGSTWNNEWGKIVVWRVGNKSDEYAPVMINLPSNGYNSEANAIADALFYADYSIPDNFKTKAVLIGAFTFRISGGVITYNSGYEDLRGQIPIVVAGGGGGGAGGVTTFLGLTDVPNSYTGQSGSVPEVNAAETALEFVPKGWIYNIARTFKLINDVESLDADRTVTWQNKNITVADDTEVVKLTGQQTIQNKKNFEVSISTEKNELFATNLELDLNTSNFFRITDVITGDITFTTINADNTQLFQLEYTMDAIGGHTQTFNPTYFGEFNESVLPSDAANVVNTIIFEVRNDGKAYIYNTVTR